MRILDIPPEILPAEHHDHPGSGAFSYIARSPTLAQLLAHEYGREDLCLKVFRADAKSLDEFRWGKGNLLVGCTKAQNLYAWFGMAPRVYDVALVNGTRWAQVTDYVEDDGGAWDRDRAHEILTDHLVGSTGGDQNDANWIGSRKVDWQYKYLGGPYEECLIRRCHEGAAWGAREEPYQAAGMEMASQRTSSFFRAVEMRWNEIDFAGTTVLDVGCNLGALCQEAHDRGAHRVVGVDEPHVAKLAYEVANWRGYWNLDFVGTNLPSGAGQIARQTGLNVFDIVLALSVKQTEPDSWAFELCEELCFFEGHVPDHEETWRPVLERRFDRVEFLGTTRDHGPRPLFRCWR